MVSLHGNIIITVINITIVIFVWILPPRVEAPLFTVLFSQSTPLTYFLPSVDSLTWSHWQQKGGGTVVQGVARLGQVSPPQSGNPGCSALQIGAGKSGTIWQPLPPSSSSPLAGPRARGRVWGKLGDFTLKPNVVFRFLVPFVRDYLISEYELLCRRYNKYDAYIIKCDVYIIKFNVEIHVIM